MSPMAIASYSFILISLLSFSYGLEQKRVKAVLTIFSFSVLGSFLYSLQTVENMDLVPILILPFLIILCYFHSSSRVVTVSFSALLLMLFSIQNIMTSSTYVFLVMLEMVSLLTLIAEKGKKNQYMQIGFTALIRIVLLLSLFILSLIKTNSNITLMILPLSLGFFVFNSLSFTGKNSIEQNYSNQFFWRFLHIVFIPLIIMYKIKESFGYTSYEHLVSYKMCICGVFSVLMVKLLAMKKETQNRTITTVDNIVVALPYTLLFLIEEIISFDVLSLILFSTFILQKIQKIEQHRIISQIYRNLFYHSPINPLTLYALIKVSESSSELWEKGLVVVFFIVCWVMVTIDSPIDEVKKAKSNRSLKYYLLTLIISSGIYIYEKI
jgi:hypothetical protein